MKSDAEIQQAVLRELKWDSRVKETDVGVEVDHGIVTLTGTVDTYAARVAAQEAAHRVAGVLDVANDVRVKTPQSMARTDTEIAQAVRQALEWDVEVPAGRIHTTVTDGWVTLEGKVDTWYQREAAERAIRFLAGVEGVVNRIEVGVVEADPQMIRDEIEDALERRAERAARHIEIDVKDGVVTLSGTVNSLAEKRAIYGAARYTPGVRAVEDRIRVEPESRL